MVKPFDLAVGEWWQVPDVGNSQLADVYGTFRTGDGSQAGIIDAWAGAAFDTLRGDLLISNGGHNDYAGNAVYAFGALPVSASYLAWRRKSDNSVRSDGALVESYPDGTPSARHTYCTMLYRLTGDELLLMAGGAPWAASGGFSSLSWTFDCANETPNDAAPAAWAALNTPAGWPQGGTTSPLLIYDSLNDLVYMFATNGFARYAPATDVWTNLTSSESNAGGANATAVFVPTAPGFMVTIGFGTTQTRRLDTLAWVGAEANWGMTGATIIEDATAPGAAWDSQGNRLIAWAGTLAGGTDNRDYYEINFETKVSTKKTGTGDIPTNPNATGTYTRFQYIGGGLCILVNSTTGHVFFLRTSINDGKEADLSRQYWSESLAWAVADGTPVANTTTETIIFPDVTIPANYMADGRILRLHAAGKLSTTATPTMTWALRWGGVAGTLLATSEAITMGSGVANVNWSLTARIQTRANGAAGSLFVMGELQVHSAVGTVLSNVFGVSGFDAPAAVTANLAADTALSLTADWSAASASNTLTGHIYLLESLN